MVEASYSSVSGCLGRIPAFASTRLSRSIGARLPTSAQVSIERDHRITHSAVPGEGRCIMWLDRFAGPHPGSNPSPPNSQSRTHSPLPRRTSSARGPYLTSQRPGLSPRGSSLSLASSDSSSSLLSASKRTNGSALRQSTTVDTGPDPEEILVRILGPLPDTAAPEENVTRPITEEDIELDFDFGGFSLRELATDDTSRLTADTYKPQTVEDCRSSSVCTTSSSCTHSYNIVERDKAKFEELHRSIRACDDILSSVESNLTSFRDDLAAVSADIETLQARSTALNVRLENRRAVEKALGPIVEELSVSPMVVSKISEGHIDEAWVKVVADLDKRAMAQKKNSQQPSYKALEDVGPLLEKLVLKVLVRHRRPGRNANSLRPSSGYATFSSPRSRPLGRPISMPK